MSDNATLVERLRSYNTPGIKMEAANRIADLEVEVARLIETNSYVNDANAKLTSVRDSRIAELEAERDAAMQRIEKYQVKLVTLMDQMDSCLKPRWLGS
jgi:hypothetical protein